jgi:hypothetical protein
MRKPTLLALSLAALLGAIALSQTTPQATLRVLSAQRGEAYRVDFGPTFQLVKPKKPDQVIVLVRLTGENVHNIKMEQALFKTGDATYTAMGIASTHDAKGKATNIAVMVAAPRSEKNFTLLIEGYAPVSVVAEDKIRAELK